MTRANNFTKWLVLIAVLFGLGLLALIVLSLPNDSGQAVSTDTQSQPRSVTPTTTPEPTILLYHYTDCFSINSIMIDGFISPSIKANGGMAVFGDGVYLADLPPTGLLNRIEYSFALFNSAGVTTKTACWLLMKVPQKEAVRVRTVYTNNLTKARQVAVGNYAIYLRRGQQPLPVDYVDQGRTVYAP